MGAGIVADVGGRPAAAQDTVSENEIMVSLGTRAGRSANAVTASDDAGRSGFLRKQILHGSSLVAMGGDPLLRVPRSW